MLFSRLVKSKVLERRRILHSVPSGASRNGRGFRYLRPYGYILYDLGNYEIDAKGNS